MVDDLALFVLGRAVLLRAFRDLALSDPEIAADAERWLLSEPARVFLDACGVPDTDSNAVSDAIRRVRSGELRLWSKGAVWR